MDGGLKTFVVRVGFESLVELGLGLVFFALSPEGSAVKVVGLWRRWGRDPEKRWGDQPR